MGSLPRSQLAEHVCRFRHPAPAHDPLADHFTDAQIAQALDHMREAIGAAAPMPARRAIFWRGLPASPNRSAPADPLPHGDPLQ
jgi:hypothetical protein